MKYHVVRQIAGLIGSMLILVLVSGACGQTATPAAPADAPESGAASEVEIRQPEDDIEAFWDNFDWADLNSAEQEAWGVLGWDATSWDEETNIPASEDATWDELTAEQQSAAESLGYTQESWDETAPE